MLKILVTLFDVGEFRGPDRFHSQILAVAALKAPQPKVLQLKQVLTLIRTFLLKIPNHHNRHNQNLKISEIVKLFFGIMYPTTNRVFGPEESIGIIF